MIKMKTALITGATGGIGKEICHQLNEQGYHLLLLGSNQNAIEALAYEMYSAIAITCDLSDSAQVQNLCDQLMFQTPSIDVAFINAGMIQPGNLVSTPSQSIQKMLDINLCSAIHLIKACSINMQAKQSGHIIATVSMGGILPLKGSATYSAAKFGLRGFLAAIHHELKPKGIKVSGLYPSGVDTAMLRYEAQNGGSALNFINKPAQVKDVAKGFFKALKTGKLEIYSPYRESLFARCVNSFPWLLSVLYPVMEKIGEQGRKRYLKAIQAL